MCRQVPGGGDPPARRWTVHVHCSTCLGIPGSRWPTRGMYLEIINRIPARAPARPVWAYGVLRIQPRPTLCLSSPKTIIYLGSEPPKNHHLPTCISGTGLGTIEVYSIDNVPVGTASAFPGLRRVPVGLSLLGTRGCSALNSQRGTYYQSGWRDRRSKFLCSRSRRSCVPGKTEQMALSVTTAHQLLAGM